MGSPFVWLRAYWVEHETDPGFKELRAYGDGLKLAPLHSQSVQAIAEDLDDAVRTYRANKKLGLVGKAPWRVKKYRPVSFTRNFGWRVTPEGKLALSYGPLCQAGVRQRCLSIPGTLRAE